MSRCSSRDLPPLFVYASGELLANKVKVNLVIAQFKLADLHARLSFRHTRGYQVEMVTENNAVSSYDGSFSFTHESLIYKPTSTVTIKDQSE